MNADEKAARGYVIEHVLYANAPGSFDRALEALQNNPEFFPEAETCDGCSHDSIAVYQSFLAGIAHGKREAGMRIADEINQLFFEVEARQDRVKIMDVLKIINEVMK